MDNRTLTEKLRDPDWVHYWYDQAGFQAADRIQELEQEVENLKMEILEIQERAET